VESLHAYLSDGTMVCSLGTSNFFMLGGVIVMTLLLRRVFCGYACPIGTISEWLNLLSRRLRIRPVTVPYRLDRMLALLKYVVLAVVLWLTWEAGELIFRGFDPCYALISRHGTDITFWAYVVAGAIAVASLAILLPFCRWLCPLAAVLNPVSRFGLTRVKRNAEGCLDCGKCSRSCPMAIPVDRVQQVTAARCISCMNCVEACPAKESSTLHWGPPNMLGRSWPQAVLVTVLLLCTTGAVASSYFFPLPSFVKSRGAPPDQVATVRLKIENLTCRGRANRLLFFLQRDDLYELPGYLKLEAWPGPGAADVRIAYDPAQTNELAIKRAITEPYYNLWDDARRSACLISTFRIEGYDPLSLDVGVDIGYPPLPP
jgi:ferredoxin